MFILSFAKNKVFDKKIFLFISVSVLMFITGCAITPSPFNETNIDKLRIGMSSTEVRTIFGSPNEVSTGVCGSATASGAWVCETWKYRISGSYQSNSFVFSVKDDVKLLNSWNVKR